LDVRLRLSIEGSGIKLRSKEGVFYPSISLQAGLPTRVSLGDLAPYFVADHLTFEGLSRSQYVQSGKLPEGAYQFCFEAVEVGSGQVVSRKSCAMAWISLSDPPLLNLPRKGDAVPYSDNLNLLFQWTPRHLSSPNSAFSTEYEFTLSELWDTGLTPEAAFLNTPPLYRTTTRTTTLLYGPGEPALLPGKRYGWRVRAINTDAEAGSDAFRNGGYSEVYYFSYQNNCSPVVGVSSEVTSGRATLSWNAPIGATTPATHYTVEYREKGQDKWYSVVSGVPKVMLYDLKAGHSYEYRVGTACAGTTGLVYSPMQGLQMPGVQSGDGYECGVLAPDVAIANREPLTTLLNGEVILAGDFPVKLLQVSGQGSFYGHGYVTVPFLGQANVKVRFANIRVNTDKQLISGVIETTYDVKEGQVADVDTVIHDVKAIINSLVTKLDRLEAALKQPDLYKEELQDLVQALAPDIEAALNALPDMPEAEKQALRERVAELATQTLMAANGSEQAQQQAIRNTQAINKELKAIEEGLTNQLEQKEAERIGEGIDFDKLVSWLIAKRDSTVTFNAYDFIRDETILASTMGVRRIRFSKPYKAVIGGVEKTLQLHGSLATETGALTLKEHNTRLPLEIDVANNKIHFATNYYFDGKPVGKESVAISLSTNSVEEFEWLLQQQRYTYGAAARKYYKAAFEKAFAAAGSDCNQLDVLYENIPSFVADSLRDIDKWQHLRALSKCLIDKVGTNEQQAIVHLLKGISPAYLQATMNEHPAFFMELYEQLGDSWRTQFIVASTQVLSQAWTGEEALKTIYPAETPVSEDPLGKQVVSCFGLQGKELAFAYSYFYKCANGWYSEAPCYGSEGSQLFNFNEHCTEQFTIPASAPVLIIVEGQPLVVPAFVAGQIMTEQMEKSYRAFIGLNVGVLLPEVLIKPATLAKWSQFFKKGKVVTSEIDYILYLKNKGFSVFEEIDNVIFLRDASNRIGKIVDNTKLDDIVWFSPKSGNTWPIHEVNCSNYLKFKYGNSVVQQLKVRIYHKNGATVDCFLDDVVKTNEGKFIISDAKHSQKAAIIDGQIPGYTSNQTQGYQWIIDGDAVQIEVIGLKGGLDIPQQTNLLPDLDGKIKVLTNTSSGQIVETSILRTKK